MSSDWQRRLSEALGDEIAEVQPLTGGDINEAHRVVLRQRGPVFVKTHASAPADAFAVEAEGLGWIAEAKAVRTPAILHVEPDMLVLEMVSSGTRARDFDEQLGRGLAALHRQGAPEFGWHRDGFIATLAQSNTAHKTWSEFYLTERLEPLLREVVDAKLASKALLGRFTQLFDTLDERVGPVEPPARLHGDLWGGNCMVDERGAPCLIDPAVYGGHREIDLAMMQLFGGFGERCFAAYDEAYPLQAGWQARVGLCQLYPLLVHVVLFGVSYLGRLEQALAQCIE